MLAAAGAVAVAAAAVAAKYSFRPDSDSGVPMSGLQGA